MISRPGTRDDGATEGDHREQPIATVFGACPLDCPDTCSWIVTVEDGRAVRLQGDPEHPFTRGVLCTKVNAYVDYTRSPDRLLYPMRRRGLKGAGEFERISWEEALDATAERLTRTARESGPEAIWPYVGSGSMGLLQGVYAAGRRLWNVLGASQHLMTICTIAGGVGTGNTLGDNRVGMDPETLRFSKLIIIWGSNTLTTNHHLWRHIATARRQGASLVVIDPIRTRTAEAADLHLAPIPGTDAALALGIMNVVLAEGGEDRDFVSRHTHGWEGFRARILDYPPERVAETCGIPAAAIVDLGKRVAHTRPLLPELAVRSTSTARPPAQGLRSSGSTPRMRRLEDSGPATRLASSTTAARSSRASR